ncbi:hypothetical protein SNOG_12122 [Parastagonospora nodorum SN15]|uniref:C-CAP/cofactor C-like domain-containing protein n=1 Tax=Phaeosphaeria nodorum (strain SN15 / ATCC MYA-4574 / FGSC 10173) TaxID=321614 RepID=Q0U7Z2_PHANO|nr:hypothetical protein SNOG_12122 [Parastagonospora nodorum SN15]EAT80534.2 hypothetical protein SNOG_12122 [Parastagonospora nodorum SN15]
MSKTLRATYRPTINEATANKGLAEQLQTARNSFNPPKKFSFKARKNAPASSTAGATESSKLATSTTADASNSASLRVSKPNENAKQPVPTEHTEDIADGIQDGPGVRRPSLSQATKVTITNHHNLHLKLPAAASHATSSGTISNLSRCVIDLSAATSNAPFSALYLKNIKDSVIICGQVAGAVHITDVENSVLVVPTRQFRMHGSKKVDIYLHSASRPIIEDCENVRFAPMPDMFASPATLQSANHWSEIDDFKWLKVEASPNFSLLAESERVSEEVWRDKVVDSEDLEDVLRVLEIQ